MGVASDISIANRALQKLGANPIASFSENSKNSRECQICYDSLRQALLGMHPWTFSTFFASLAVLNPPNPPPVSLGGTTALQTYNLPNDYLKLVAIQWANGSWASCDASFYVSSGYFLDGTDYLIQNNTIVTWIQAPLNIRYVRDFTNAALMAPLFREALSALMAQEMCERLTQSNTKKASMAQDFKDVITEARRINAIEKAPQLAVDDDYILVRR